VIQASRSALPCPVASTRVLLQAVLRADRAAYQAFFEIWFLRVYRYVDARVEGRAEAERLTERSMRKILDQLPGCAGEPLFAAWVLSIVRRELAGAQA